MKDVYQRIYETGIIPVIKIDDAKDAVPLAKALIDGGLPAAEITFRTAAAADAIKAISEAYPDMLIGAGTVLTPEQADTAIACGAHFIVSPGFNPTVVKHCISKGYIIIPGTSNPSDVEAAIELGLTTVKFFPAEAAGGLPMLKSMAAPYTMMKFMPTGGLNEKNILSYLEFNKVVACGGSFMVKDEYIKNGEFDKIRELTENAVKLMLGFKLVHVGINADNAEDAEKFAKMFEVFGLTNKIGNSSIFAGTEVEVMKGNGRGKYGHIAIATNNIPRAEAYLAAKGVKVIEESRNCDEKGNTKAIYLDMDVNGFAVHLVKAK
ncbi:MAG: bifunctional 4-hydroxy-2-oxoglutarate aldolase/2-dehydro-3-deoxy-phosphogluconate aldolase [Ruminococcaceae bacterium]|nr:bifunctional 4-hydroxy-2-oxoglutarate aldolase/2-dehydro-3-deoxy-phosphogluconate aldolase [Oscillospiraceae bacterium]